MPDASRPEPPQNPWMTALTALWIALLALAVLLCLLGANAHTVQGDDVLSIASYASAATAAGFAALVVAVQLGVKALQWYLDEASRPLRTPRARPPYVRQDF